MDGAGPVLIGEEGSPSEDHSFEEIGITKGPERDMTSCTNLVLVSAKALVSSSEDKEIEEGEEVEEPLS